MIETLYSSGLSLIFPVGGEMKKVAGGQDFLELGPWDGGGGGGARVEVSG